MPHIKRKHIIKTKLADAPVWLHCMVLHLWAMMLKFRKDMLSLICLMPLTGAKITLNISINHVQQCSMWKTTFIRVLHATIHSYISYNSWCWMACLMTLVMFYMYFVTTGSTTIPSPRTAPSCMVRHSLFCLQSRRKYSHPSTRAARGYGMPASCTSTCIFLAWMHVSSMLLSYKMCQCYRLQHVH